MTTLAPELERPSHDSRPRTTPYQGLRPYTEEDAEYFFGRSAWREIIADHLLGYRVTVLYGPSGVGKSSVLHAGVIDELRGVATRNAELSGRPELLPVIVSGWSGDPLVSLSEAVQSCAAAIAPGLAEEPPQGSLAEVLTAWSERVGGLVLVILDQFDEYFTYYERSAEASPFADELAEAVADRDVPAHFLFSIREDALAKLDLFEDRIPDLWQNLLRIEHLDHVAAREAIELPVARWNEREAAADQTVELEPGLVEAVLSEAEPDSVDADKAGSGRIELTEEARAAKDLVEAPYLQLVMSRLWEEERQSGSRALRVATLRRLGGGDRIFRSHFDSVMRSLPRRQRAVASRIFQYLVTPGGTKIALPASALAKWAKQKEAKVSSVLKTLAAGERRILRTVSSPGEGDAETSYEIFHDRLAPGILDWRRRYGRRRTIRRVLLVFVPPLAIALVVAIVVIGFQRSRNAELDSRVFFFEVEEAARRSPQFGAMLPPHDGPVNSVAVNADGRRIATAGDDGAVVVSRSRVDYGEFDVETNRVVNAQGPNSALFSPNGRLLGVDTAGPRALVWGPKGRRFEIPASTTSKGLAFSPNGRRVLTALDDGTAHLWDVRSGTSVAEFRGAAKPLYAALLSANGRQVATVGRAVARVWDATRPKAPGTPYGTGKKLILAALSPDGASLLTMSAGDTRLWKLGNHESIPLEEAGPRAGSGLGYSPALADFTPEGHFAVAGRTAVPVYDSSGRRTVLLSDRMTTTPTTVVRFSPDGKLVATGDRGGTVHVWDVRTGRRRAHLDAHRGAVTSLAFSPDAGLVVSGAADGTAIVWLLMDVQRQIEAAARRSPYFHAMLPEHESQVESVATAPDGGQGYRFATTSDDGTVVLSGAPNVRAGALDVFRERVLNIDVAVLALFSPNGELLGVETADAWAGVWGRNGKKRFEVPASSEYLSLAFTPDGRRILTALDDGTAHLWDVRSGKSLVVVRAPEKPLYSASMSRSGRQIVTVGRATVRVWDVARPRMLPRPFRTDGDLAYAALSPDARSLLTVSDGEVRLWNVRAHDSVRLARGGQASGGVFDYDLADFAADGTFALGGRRDVPIYDSSGRRLLVLQGHQTLAEAVRFSADGKLVATGDLRGEVRVWDVYTGKQVASLNAHLGPVTSLAFSADGALLVTGASDGTAIVWRVPGGRAPASR